ncbi:interleukin-10 receptor subunit beta-like [Leuresthes tenuis]|uniref:interleukin-10 receptor subunit beta-like n=1 Tax=Leuresthes tenuis TaxID=355514 RepID=UPI003B50C0C8
MQPGNKCVKDTDLFLFVRRDNMSAVCALILTFSALSGGASGVLSGPTNVQLNSTNLNLVLAWDAPEGAPSGLVYTAQFRSLVLDYFPGCLNTSALQCDLPTRDISQYGTYTGQVRAQLGAESSPWAESNKITLDTDTYIGSPIVSILSKEATLEVIIKDPVFSISTLRDVYNFASYNITYWKSEQPEEIKSISNIQQNRVVLNDLEPLSEYCVQVQINTVRNLKPSKPSSIICESTTSEKEVQWVAAVVVFVIMAVIVAAVVLTVLNWKSISQILCPKDTLVQQYKEFLLAPPNSSMFLAMQESQPPKEINHQVRVIADDRTVEEGDAGKAAAGEG